MATPTPSPTTVSLKLLIDPISQRVVFAEAGKDFVDFLFNIMSLPVGTMIRLLGKQGTVGCIGKIYDSIEKLGDSYMLSAQKKDMLLKPMVTIHDANVALLFPSMQSSTYTNLYKCNSNLNGIFCKTVTNEPDVVCPSCRYRMYHNLVFVNPTNKASNSGDGGFVKGVIPYLVMDDLMVRPMSTETIITLLSKFYCKDLGDLEMKVVSVGVNEGVELLRASMQSKKVLTAVFLGKEEISVNLELV